MSQPYTDLLARLTAADVDFVLIGGYACIVQGGTITTEDIDICCDFTAANLLRLQGAIADLHPVHRMTPQRRPLVLTSENCRDLKNLYLDTDLGQLDCVSAVEGVGDFSRVEQAGQTIETEGVRLKVLNRDALIQSKKAMNRPRDRQAVQELETLKKLEENSA